MRSKFSFLHVDGYNHGQNIVDKLAKLSKIGVSLEWFTGDVSQYFRNNYETFVFWRPALDLLSIPSFSGIFLKLFNLLRP